MTPKNQEMKVKYNRVSTLNQTGNRFATDTDNYDLTLMDKVSGSIPFSNRPKGMEVIKLVESGQLSELVVEEFSRLGRNTGDVIQTLEYLEQHEVNVVVRNLGIQSRPMGKKNPIWKLISSTLSSLYELELENIRERTQTGRMIYIQNGGILGRPTGSNESEKEFIEKANNQEIIKYLRKERTIREICKILEVSNKTVVKVRRIASKYGMLNEP